MKATIVYYSHKGKTARYGREMAFHLYQMGVSVSFCSTADFKPEMLHNCDLLLLGCWTSGFFVINQKPHEAWVDFAKTLPAQLPAHLLLFTTYKYCTGSMFRNMRKHLNLNHVTYQSTLKSRFGLLTPEDKATLEALVAQARQAQSIQP